MRTVRSNDAKGFALLGALLLLFLISAVSVGLVYMVNSEGRVNSNDLENNLAYYGAEAAMEKMTADLGALYLAQQSPNVKAIQDLAKYQPTLPATSYPVYQFDVPNNGGVPISETRNISSGPNEGLVAQIIPMTLTVVARRASGAEVKIVRNVEFALIPVFQFGIFSDSDLSFFAGPPFDFGGRTHTNGNLFLASGDSISGLKFHTRITVVKEVIRQVLANGQSVATGGHDKSVFIPTTAAGCDPANPPSSICRNMDLTEGSKQLGPTSADNPKWTNISLNTYNGMVLNGKTGAKPLTLPFVGGGLSPVQIIRRPPAGEDPTSAVGESRLYNQANIRVLLSDNPADLPGGVADKGNIRLANVDQNGLAYSNGIPVSGAANTYFAEGKTGVTGESDWIQTDSTKPSWPLIDGYLRVEARQKDGTYAAVTQEWLELGFARGLSVPNSESGINNSVHPNAILILQQQADRNADGALTGIGETAAITGSGRRNNWYPINMYDAREGEVRDTANTQCALGGVMNLVELDVKNLQGWLQGTIGSNGTKVDWVPAGGYLLYFSDRRGMLPPAAGQPLLGEYGFEDVINPDSTAGTPDGLLAAAEDVNGSGALETYGAGNLANGFRAYSATSPANGDPTLRINCVKTARKNWVSGARHALRVENGALGNLPVNTDGTAAGFTVASETPVYVIGNYNANSSGFGDPHDAAAVIADAVTLLSANWSDLNSFNNPTNPGSRAANTSWYRLAIAAGKNINFSSVVTGTSGDYGTDGGVHNFLRYLESWSGQTLNYRGSLVSLYYSQYGVGVFKCCTTVYSPPNRKYDFDLDFLNPAKLPPGTPRFRDVNNNSSYQDFHPR
jgi:hypothetical protein